MCPLVLLLVFPFSTVEAHAVRQRSSLDVVIDSLYGMCQYQEVAISPDGLRVAWVETRHKALGLQSPASAIFVASLASPAVSPLRITPRTSGGAYLDIAWSPDSSRLAFLSNAQIPGQFQLYIAGAAGGPARRLTSLTGSLAKPRWSPDGKTLALLFIENAPRKPGPMGPMLPASGPIGEKIYSQRLTAVDVATGRFRELSPADLNIYEYDWSPDGKRFAVIAGHGEPDNNWYLAELFVVDRASGETRRIAKLSMQIAVPRWSPDGKSLAFIGGLMSDEGLVGGDIYQVPADGGEVRNLTRNLKASSSWLSWRREEEILLLENLDGASGIATLNVSNDQISPLWSGPETLSVLPSAGTRNPAVSLARDGQTCALIRESGTLPPEVWAGPIGAWRQITHSNDPAHPNWGKEESIHWSNDGFNIQGWLTYPIDYNPTRRYPLVVQVHGGPGSVARPRWPITFFDFTLLSHVGYFVLRPNPRGSFGQGEAFTRANVKDFGYGDLRDILAGVDSVVKNFPVDSQRVGVGGWSYGGFMTMWAVTQTNRFRASVAGAGIANWQSYYGQNEIPQWVIPFFGASVYDDPAIYARSSPINFIKAVKTPALILVGERDGACPPPQSFEFWRALQELKVESQLVVYPNEGHNIAGLEHRRDIMRRVTEWFDHHLK
jgi:dipeptidyl aminopeptidase/acylaminoacyl peptidase